MTTAERPRARRAGRRWGTFTDHALLAPALLLSALVVLVPGIFTAVTAFTDFNGVDLHPAFIGLQNFREILADPVFWRALRNNVAWTLVFLTIPVALGLGSATLLLRRPKTRSTYQVIFLLPYVLAAVTNAVVWLNVIYDPINGVVGYVRHHGLDLPAPLSDPGTALFAVAGVDVWHYWGFLTIVYLAALRQVPVEQVEAALLEGANGWQLFRHVYLPNIKSTLQLMFVMIVIFSFLAFDYVFLMTQGGPAHTTEMLSTYAYTFAFATFQFGKAAAVGLVMSLFGLIASCLYVAMNRREVSV